jgi:hypothetical protein
MIIYKVEESKMVSIGGYRFWYYPTGKFVVYAPDGVVGIIRNGDENTEHRRI